MGFPSIEPSSVGVTGLLWLFCSYGCVLFYASNLISEGSDLLLLVPSMAGLVGGVVLPLLGAVPDGAIMLFSGLGDLSVAQETLSVGVGALAGSTIMLLTVPWALGVFAGRVDLNADKTPNYFGNPKLTPNMPFFKSLTNTGVAITDEVKHGSIIMILTTIPYFLIQVPASFLHGPTEEVAAGEKYWALAGLIVCLLGFVIYLRLQLVISRKGMDKMKRVAVTKKLLQQGKVSLVGALHDTVARAEAERIEQVPASYQPLGAELTQKESVLYSPSASTYELMKDILRESFRRYDENRNGSLDKKEVKVFFRDFHESISNDEVDELFSEYDSDGDGTISFEEFVGACYSFIIKYDDKQQEESFPRNGSVHNTLADAMFNEDEEQEDIPEDISSLSPEKQQSAIKKRAFFMLFLGTTLVVVFSDPMVDVMQEIAVRIKLSPFYVSFILAPLASNASEVLASQYYAAKKTRKTIAVSFTALEGAASMNNTFCLSIFMGLIFFRGLAWHYTAETIAIVAVQVVIVILAQRSTMSTLMGCLVLSIFPLSIALVAFLEAIGFD